jgi:hypothetical protein
MWRYSAMIAFSPDADCPAPSRENANSPHVRPAIHVVPHNHGEKDREIVTDEQEFVARAPSVDLAEKIASLIVGHFSRKRKINHAPHPGISTRVKRRIPRPKRDDIAMRWMAVISLAAMVVGSYFADLGAAMAADCGTPTDFHDGWTVAAPDQEGLDPALICGIGPRLEAFKEANAHGIVIARHGLLVYERYFAGKDWRQGM